MQWAGAEANTLFADGVGPSEVSRRLQLSLHMCTTVHQQFQKGDVDGAEARCSKMSPAQVEALREWIQESGGKVSVRAVKAWILETIGLNLSVQTVWKTMRMITKPFKQVVRHTISPAQATTR